ncbi:glycosyltransferase family 2 protein [Gloeobacter violaceus]|uniref:Gll2192 protein n=1 Tax=Gloeobacter violaceus (strain ATCC 29082 / PCC 7421) TaxID=251221 RepID=Q7NIJ1_GLOVI|nr:glycosyltransferase family 2 protein [Gloeobacter violaceus]BAC90133.1 gll2192 [Gloeobacter violaceus PCC 7421]
MDQHHPPRVTIGIPVYNGADYLEQALESVIHQTFTDLDILIFDNGSTDRTPAICHAYAKHDRRIRLYRSDKNLGAAYSQSEVVRLSNSEYFKWAHHDDVCAPALIERCVEVLDREPGVVVCYASTCFIDAQGHPIKDDRVHFDCHSQHSHTRFRHVLHCFYRQSAFSNPLFGLMRTAALKQTRLIASYPSSDRVMLAELALYGEYYELPERLFFRRDHPQRSVLAHRTIREVDKWFNPNQKDRILPVNWVWLGEYLKSVHRARMNAFERLACYMHMCEWSLWNGKGLVRDLLTQVPQAALKKVAGLTGSLFG